MSGHALIISDLHLGRPGRRSPTAEALRPLWQDADELIVNGDVAEVHHPHYRGVAAREVLRLADLCHEDGVRITVISGNHDAYLTDRRHLLLADGRIIVTHGDSLHPQIVPWSPDAHRLESAYRAAMQHVDDPAAPTLEDILAASQHAAHHEWIITSNHSRRAALRRLLTNPRCMLEVIRAWRNYPVHAAAFAALHVPDAQVIVFGHTHRAGVWTPGERIVMNTGSFGWPGRPHAVLVDGETVSLWPIETRRRHGHRLHVLGAAPKHTVHLAPSSIEDVVQNTPVETVRPTDGPITHPAA